MPTQSAQLRIFPFSPALYLACFFFTTQLSMAFPNLAPVKAVPSCGCWLQKRPCLRGIERALPCARGLCLPMNGNIKLIDQTIPCGSLWEEVRDLPAGSKKRPAPCAAKAQGAGLNGLGQMRTNARPCPRSGSYAWLPPSRRGGSRAGCGAPGPGPRGPSCRPPRPCGPHRRRRPGSACSPSPWARA